MERREFLFGFLGSVVMRSLSDYSVTASSLIQADIDNLYSSGGGVLHLGPGRILVDEPLVLKPNVSILGAGPETVFVAGRPSMKVFDGHGGSVAGRSGLARLRIEGYGLKLPTRGSEADRAVVLGPFSEGWCVDVEIHGSRWVSLTCRGHAFSVTGCTIGRGFRDGIQMYDVPFATIRNNIIYSVADDGISCMTARGSKDALYAVGASRTVIENNILSHCTGIKVLGRSNVEIRNNKLKKVYGYGVFLGVDLNFEEGLLSSYRTTVSDNVMEDILSLSNVSANSGIAGIYISGADRRMGNDGRPLVFADAHFSRNRIVQRIGSSGAEEQLWWINGTAPRRRITTIVAEGGDIMRGIYAKRGRLERLSFTDNTIEGFAEPILFEGSTATHLEVERNSVSRCTRPSVFPRM